MLKDFLNKKITAKIDRPKNSVHPKYKEMIYPINYGYIENTVSGDGEEIDVYVLGEDNPQEYIDCEVVAIVKRKNDNEDKLIAVASSCNKTFSKKEMMQEVYFQEKYFDSEILTKADL